VFIEAIRARYSVIEAGTPAWRSARMKCANIAARA
jgi:hypothetical protein